jgi:hypothetical protein
MNDAQRFFYKHAGYSWDHRRGETQEQGHQRCARDLASAEAERKRIGAWVTWEWDVEGDASGHHPAWIATLHRYGPNGESEQSVTSLGGITTDPNANPNAKRVIEAELSLEL